MLYEYEQLMAAASNFETNMVRLGHENYARAVAAVADKLQRCARLHMKRLARSNDNGQGD